MALFKIAAGGCHLSPDATIEITSFPSGRTITFPAIEGQQSFNRGDDTKARVVIADRGEYPLRLEWNYNFPPGVYKTVTVTIGPDSSGDCSFGFRAGEGIQAGAVTTLQGQPQVVVMQQKQGLSWIWWMLIILAIVLLVRHLGRRTV